MLAGKPLQVPTMLVHGLWDQEDIYGAIAVYRIDLSVALFVPLVFFEGLHALNAGSKAAGLLIAAVWFGAVMRRRVDAIGVIRRHRRMLEGLALFLVWLSLGLIWAESSGKAAGDREPHGTRPRRENSRAHRFQ